MEKSFPEYEFDTIVHFAAESHVDRSIPPAAMRCRYTRSRNYSVSGGSGLSGFPDVNNVAGYARDAMSLANAAALFTAPLTGA